MLEDANFVGNGLRYHVGNGFGLHTDKFWSLLFRAGSPRWLAVYFSWWHILLVGYFEPVTES